MTLAPLGFGAFGGTVAGQSAHTLGTAAYLVQIVDGDLGELTEGLDDIEFTNSNSPIDGNGRAYKQFSPGDIIDGGEYEITILFNYQTTQIPWGVPETITITLPKRGTTATAATISFPGYLKKHKTSLKSKSMMEVTCTLKVAGVVVRTAAS